MAKITLPLRDIKVEYARSHPLTKVVVVALILVCMAALITLSVTGSQLKREIAQLREEAAVLAAENAELKEKIESLGSVEGIEHIAREELDMVDPDTIVIDPKP